MQFLKQSTGASIIVGPVLDATGLEYASALIGDISVSSNGGASSALANTATLVYIANGFYTLTLRTTDTATLGRLDIICNKSTYQMPPVRLEVLQPTVFDAFVTNAAGGLNGLPLSKANNIVDSNVISVGPTGANTAQTARDIGASVLLSSGTGTGQLDFTSGVVKASLVQILGTALTETAGQIAAAFKQFFNIASPTSTMNRITLVDTVTTNTDMRGTDNALLAANYTAPANSTISAIQTTIGTNGAGLTSLGDTRLENLDAAVSTRLATAGYTAPDNSTITAINAKTTNLPADPADASDVAAAFATVNAAIAALNDLSASDIFTTQMSESYATDGTAPTLAQCLFLIQQSLHEFSISGTSRTVKKLDGSTTAAVFTLDSATAPTSTTRTA